MELPFSNPLSLSPLEILKREKIAKSRYLAWKGLHLSKSKLTNVVEMASFMAGFAVVRKTQVL